MSDLMIDMVKTGKGLAGSRMALVFAPKDAPAGTLSELTRFFNAQDHLRAIPGYHGPSKNHVLRISGLKDDASFLKLLQEELPKWFEDHNMPADTIQVSDSISAEPIDEVEHFPHANPIRRFVKENANALTGLAYIAGNMGLLYSAWRKPAHMPNGPAHDWFKTYSSFAYNVSSVALISFGYRADNPRDVYSIMEDLYPQLQQADEQQRAQLYDTTERTLAFLKNHPWEVSSAITASGAASHLISSLKRSSGHAKGAKVEAISALGTLTACAITTLVPEKDGRDITDVSSIFERDESQSVLGSLEQLQNQEPHKGYLAIKMTNAIAAIQNSPLLAAAGIQAVSNTGYGIAAIKRRPFDPGLFIMSGSYLLGNVTQSQATKGRGPGFDDVVTAAAAIMHADPLLAEHNPEDISRRIDRFADVLTGEKEIVHNKRRLKKGIRERLARYDLPRAEEGEILTGFIPSEQRMLMQSPFVKPRYVERVFNEMPDANEASSASVV